MCTLAKWWNSMEDIFAEDFFNLMVDTYWATVFMYVGASWSRWTQLQHIFGLAESNTSLFESFEALFGFFTLTHSLISSSEIHDLVRDNKSQVSQYTAGTVMCCIVRPGPRISLDKYIFVAEYYVFMSMSTRSDINTKIRMFCSVALKYPCWGGGGISPQLRIKILLGEYRL